MLSAKPILMREQRGDADFVVRVPFEMMRDVKDRLDRYLTSRITFHEPKPAANTDRFGRRDPSMAGSPRLRPSCDWVTKFFLKSPSHPAAISRPTISPSMCLYEDEYILVINKEPDIIVHPARAENRGTMLNALVHHFEKTGLGRTCRRSAKSSPVRGSSIGSIAIPRAALCLPRTTKRIGRWARSFRIVKSISGTSRWCMDG